MLRAFVESDRGNQIWTLHRHLEVPLAATQDELYPIQRRFLMLAADEYGEDPDSSTNIPPKARKHM